MTTENLPTIADDALFTESLSALLCRECDLEHMDEDADESLYEAARRARNAAWNAVVSLVDAYAAR